MFPSIFNITLGSMFWHGIATFEPRRHDFCASSVQHDKTDKENIGYCTICKFKILIKTAFTYRIGCEGIFLNPNLNWHLHSLSLCPLLWSSSHLPPFATVPFPDLLLSWHPLQVLLPFMVPLSLCVYLPFHSPPFIFRPSLLLLTQFSYLMVHFEWVFVVWTCCVLACFLSGCVVVYCRKRFASAKASFIAVVRAYMFIYGLMCCFDGPLVLSCFTTL